MDNNSLISVIIPVYNVKPYLEEALDSVLNQTYRNLEIIIVDDGSNDGSEKMCDDYGNRDSRVRVIHQRNKGLSGARNTGLEIMTGEAVAFMDSDDAYFPDYIREMVQAMVRTNADIVICKSKTYHTDGKMLVSTQRHEPLYLKPGVYTREEALTALIGGEIRHGVWNKLYNRELWKTVRFPEGRVYEDVSTTYRILDKCNSVCHLDLALYKYRRRSGSITFSGSWKYYRDWLDAHSGIDAYFQSHVPDLFSETQLINWRRSSISLLISFYVKCSRKKRKTNKARCETVRRKIIELGRENGVKGIRFRTRTAYYMLSFCPWLFRAVYPLYMVGNSVRSRILRMVVRNSDS
ncbi:MAG: glycosyltransferase family 2 protein [Lachnospiraceae bacterium]|nr:glycosyltransferase family 2 protein [Lachnospiraceae bacterium]